MTVFQLQLVPRLIQQLLWRDLPGFNPANPLVREEQREERQETLGQCPKQSCSEARLIPSGKGRSGSKRCHEMLPAAKATVWAVLLSWEAPQQSVVGWAGEGKAWAGPLAPGECQNPAGKWPQIWKPVSVENRFAAHEDRFLERRLLKRREELALQAVLGMLLWPPMERRGGAHSAEWGWYGSCKTNLY